MLKIMFTRRMKRDVKRMKRRGKDMDKLTAVLDALARREALPERNRDRHARGAVRRVGKAGKPEHSSPFIKNNFDKRA